MDINLKNNKSFNLRILISGLCITLLPIILGICTTILQIISRIITPFYIIGKGGLVLLYILVVMFLVNTIKDKTLIFKETYIIRLYSRMFLELRTLLVIVMIYSLFWLYKCIFYSDTFSDQNLIILIVTFVLTYFVQIDFYKLYILNETNKLENYIYGKSILYKLYKLIIEGLTKSTSSKVELSIILSIIYTVIIFITGVLTADHQCFIYYGILILCVAFSALIVIIVFLIYISIDINAIEVNTHNIANGNYNKIGAKKQLFFKDIAKNLIEIENGLNIAIDKAVTSERMKGELITNVSHDLKTPLTSIINYVDLLDNDNISDEKRKTYLEILKERSQRLKVLIEDLFEASKAASGNLEMHMEDLDPVALLRQTLGEFEDKISTFNLDFIKKIPDQKLTIYADGKKTFRIFQNLISNILKYSLSGTRVYIDVDEEKEFVSITLKNISKYPLNFTEEEILERFKRGDSSRTTEGSGLGLSIAKSLVELQGGIFEIKLDGDLFKVIVLLRNINFS